MTTSAAWIPRIIEPQLKEALSGPLRKVVILYGARQTGKTTLAHHLLDSMEGRRILRVNADLDPMQEVFSSRNLHTLRLFLADYDLVFIDEAQRIPDIGINLKIIHDELPEVRLFVTGSSSLELANHTFEPLTGRTLTWWLYPLSADELARAYGTMTYHTRLAEWMIFGSYPEIVRTPGRQMKIRLLKELTEAYLYKDVLELASLRNSQQLRQLLRLLAFQSGSEVSWHELGQKLGMASATVQRYVDLLEKAFVIKVVSSYSRNLRKEVSKKKKVFFLDTGIRNALIDQFAPLESRTDVGILWENYLFIERTKWLHNHMQYANQYFWRLHSGAELDYVEEQDGALHAYEFKFNKRRAKPPKSWQEAYPEADFQLIHKDNYLPFLLGNGASS